MLPQSRRAHRRACATVTVTVGLRFPLHCFRVVFKQTRTRNAAQFAVSSWTRSERGAGLGRPAPGYLSDPCRHAEHLTGIDIDMPVAALNSLRKAFDPSIEATGIRAHWQYNEMLRGIAGAKSVAADSDSISSDSNTY